MPVTLMGDERLGNAGLFVLRLLVLLQDQSLPNRFQTRYAIPAMMITRVTLRAADRTWTMTDRAPNFMNPRPITAAAMNG